MEILTIQIEIDSDAKEVSFDVEFHNTSPAKIVADFLDGLDLAESNPAAFQAFRKAANKIAVVLLNSTIQKNIEHQKENLLTRSEITQAINEANQMLKKFCIKLAEARKND